MLNFRVRDLDAMLAQLRAKGADVAEQTQDMAGVGRLTWSTQAGVPDRITEDLADQQDGDIRTATLVITAPAGQRTCGPDPGKQRPRTPLPDRNSRPLCVRGPRNATVYSATR